MARLKIYTIVTQQNVFYGARKVSLINFVIARITVSTFALNN